MSRLLLKIFEYPKKEEVLEEDLTSEGRHMIISEARDLIYRLKEAKE